MDPHRTVQKVFNSKPYGSRKVGRPKLRWEDGVLQDIRAQDVRIWRDIDMSEEECQGPPWAVEPVMRMIILPSTPRYYKWSLPFSVSDQNFV
jgi:hypothetical protein